MRSDILIVEVTSQQLLSIKVIVLIRKKTKIALQRYDSKTYLQQWKLT